jgi:hypothetical protein
MGANASNNRHDTSSRNDEDSIAEMLDRDDPKHTNKCCAYVLPNLYLMFGN